MKRIVTLAAALFFMLFSSSAARCEESVAFKLFDSLDAGVSYKKDYFAKSVSSLDYDIARFGFYVGNTNGTRFFINKTNGDVSRNAANSKWNTRLRMKEYGAQIGAKFRLLPGGSTAAIGFARREFSIDPFTEYVYQGDCQPCLQFPGFADTFSNPYYIKFGWDAPGPWKFGFDYGVEKLHLDTSANRALRTTSIGFSASRQFGRFEAGGMIKRMMPSEQPRNKWELKDNTNLEFGLAYRPVIHTKISLTAGMYTDGLPVSSGVFSEIGEMFVFNYIGATSSFKRMYEEKVGYISLGAEISLK